MKLTRFFLWMLISAQLIKRSVNFRDLNFHYFGPKFSIHFFLAKKEEYFITVEIRQ